jgi:hypothetical protein
MARIGKVQPIVHNLLIDKPETRADDFILVLEVYKHFVNENIMLGTALAHHRELGLPSFASILRSRRKIQSQYPELVNKATAEIRAQEETEYRDYALNS